MRYELQASCASVVKAQPRAAPPTRTSATARPWTMPGTTSAAGSRRKGVGVIVAHDFPPAAGAACGAGAAGATAGAAAAWVAGAAGGGATGSVFCICRM